MLFIYRYAERYELKLGVEKYSKDLSYIGYADRLEDIHSAKPTFILGKIAEKS